MSSFLLEETGDHQDREGLISGSRHNKNSSGGARHKGQYKLVSLSPSEEEEDDLDVLREVVATNAASAHPPQQDAPVVPDLDLVLPEQQRRRRKIRLKR